MTSQKGLTKEFLAERDLRIFKMRQAGVANSEIARRFNISVGAVNQSVQRQLQKLNREALLAYPEVLRMELERLDALQQAIWPLTQHRKVKADDGTEISVEPDLKAIQQVLSIIDRRARLLGMEQTNINLNVEQPDIHRVSLAGATNQAAKVDAFNPETEARQLLELMGSAGVLPDNMVKELLSMGTPSELAPVQKDDEIIVAEIVDAPDKETTYGIQ